ncbi:MAG: DUF1345 domain-containing protein [Proteobacteria bacterium]|nr:DUF1345 domain-containing protein [Pseudomonadota bacterium]
MRRIARFASSRRHLLAAILAGIIASVAIPGRALLLMPGGKAHTVLSWDVGAAVFILLWAGTMLRTPPHEMPARAKAQEDGEWTVFTLTLAGIVASVVAIVIALPNIASLKGEARAVHLALVIITLVISWLTMQLVFALRYSHEFYATAEGSSTADGGLEFPKEPAPDYFDFFYFGMVLGMTFQVSDVDITSRKIRRLATLHGFIGFVFNTVILALTVNIAAGLL